MAAARPISSASLLRDVVYTDTDTHQVLIHKVLTTPADPSVGVLTGITDLCKRHGINPIDVHQLYHGTTIATNALLEYKGARVGVVTTKGYRDILHIGRHQRPQHYSIQQEIPWQDRPLARRRHRKVVTERLIPPKGDVLVPLSQSHRRDDPLRPLDGAGKAGRGECGFGKVAGDRGPWRVATAEVKRA